MHISIRDVVRLISQSTLLGEGKGRFQWESHGNSQGLHRIPQETPEGRAADLGLSGSDGEAEKYPEDEDGLEAA